MKRLLSILLVLGLFLSLLSGCSNGGVTNLLLDPTLPDSTTSGGNNSDTPINPNDPNRDLVINEAKLEYTLTNADFEEFEQMLADFEISAMTVSDADEVDRLYSPVDDKFCYLDAQTSIATLLYYSDLNDKDASDEYLFASKALSEARDSCMVLMRRIYEGNYAAKDALFAEWTEAEIRSLMQYTEEIKVINQRNSEINVAYQDLQSDPDMESKMIPLYLELVQNNNRIAEIYGYDNFYEYAYAEAYLRDYGEEQIEDMRRYTATYLIPAMEGAVQRFNSTYQSLSYSEQQFFTEYMYAAFYDLSENYLEDYLKVLPANTRGTMLNMFDGDILLLDSVSSAMEGAFTTTVGPERNICFFGPNCSVIETVIHEAGHYYACEYTLLHDIPLDLAEVHSQGNEWLFTAYMKNQVSENLYQAIVNYKIFMELASVILCQTVDAFEEKVYTYADPSSLTEYDLNRMMEEACEQFGGIDFYEEMITDPQYYWRMVVVEQPVYYISYSVSAMAAIDLFTVAEEDFDKAVDSYVYLCEELDPDRGFLGNLEDADLSGPFSKDTYLWLYEMCTE